jgi:diguanylate cyclase (GGDEF)-like protein
MSLAPRHPSDHAPRFRVIRYAVGLFLVIATIIVAVAATLDRGARRSTWQQENTALTGAARVSATEFGALRANLRVEASQLATSLDLQRAVVGRNDAALHRLSVKRHARIDLPDRSVGELAQAPRIATSARITDGSQLLASVTVSLPLGKDVLALLRQATPLPEHGALVLVSSGRVLAGGPIGSRAQVRGGRIVFGDTQFAAQSARLQPTGVSVLALEPASAIDAASQRYRRLVLLAAAATLALAAALAARIARPVALIVGEAALLSRQATTDALTGLANRRGLNDRLDAELARAAGGGTSVSFVIADVDDFKSINDRFGHQTGDMVIRAVGNAVAESVRELDLAARYGGEEFAVILPGSRLDDARRAAERMRVAVSLVEVPGLTGTLSMSFGVAEFPTYADGHSLVAAADAALYQAKRGGKDQVVSAVVERHDLRLPVPVA